MAAKRAVLVRLQGRGHYTRILSGAPQTSGMRSGLVRLGPGQQVGEHSTEHKEEALVLLSGKAEISCAGRNSFVAHAPAVVYIPADTTHNVKNKGKEILRYVYVVAPVIP